MAQVYSYIIAANAVLCQQPYPSFPALPPVPPGHQLWVAARDGIRDNSPSYSAEKSPAVRATANLERASLEAGTRQTNIETSAPTWTPVCPGRDETRNADFQE